MPPKLSHGSIITHGYELVDQLPLLSLFASDIGVIIIVIIIWKHKLVQLILSWLYSCSLTIIIVVVNIDGDDHGHKSHEQHQ